MTPKWRVTRRDDAFTDGEFASGRQDDPEDGTQDDNANEAANSGVARMLQAGGCKWSARQAKEGVPRKV